MGLCRPGRIRSASATTRAEPRWHRLNLRPLPHQHGSLALGTTAGAHWWVWTQTASSAAPQPGQQAQELEVQPEQVEHDGEAGVPLHRLGRAGGDPAADEVEIEQEV